MKFVGDQKKANRMVSVSTVHLNCPLHPLISQAEIIYIMKYQDKQLRPHFRDEKLFQSLLSKKGPQ